MYQENAGSLFRQIDASEAKIPYMHGKYIPLKHSITIIQEEANNAIYLRQTT